MTFAYEKFRDKHRDFTKNRIVRKVRIRKDYDPMAHLLIAKHGSDDDTI